MLHFDLFNTLRSEISEFKSNVMISLEISQFNSKINNKKTAVFSDDGRIKRDDGRIKTDLETIYQALTETFQCCQGKARMVLGGDFNCRLDSSERGNSLCEFLINWNLHCVNDIKEVTYEFQYGKSVIDLFFVSKNILTR